MTKPLLKKCLSCNSYTLRDICPKCKGKTISAHPPKFSPDDKYMLLRNKESYKKVR